MAPVPVSLRTPPPISSRHRQCHSRRQDDRDGQRGRQGRDKEEDFKVTGKQEDKEDVKGDDADMKVAQAGEIGVAAGSQGKTSE